jgi:hypothetical protein
LRIEDGLVVLLAIGAGGLLLAGLAQALEGHRRRRDGRGPAEPLAPTSAPPEALSGSRVPLGSQASPEGSALASAEPHEPRPAPDVALAASRGRFPGRAPTLAALPGQPPVPDIALAPREARQQVQADAALAIPTEELSRGDIAPLEPTGPAVAAPSAGPDPDVAPAAGQPDDTAHPVPERLGDLAGAVTPLVRAMELAEADPPRHREACQALGELIEALVETLATETHERLRVGDLDAALASSRRLSELVDDALRRGLSPADLPRALGRRQDLMLQISEGRP